METLHDSATTEIQQDKIAANSSWLAKFEKDAEFNRYGLTSMFFLLIGICGGVAIGVSACAHIWQISAIAIFTMLSLSLMLAVAPMKYILRATALALFVDIFLVVMNMIF